MAEIIDKGTALKVIRDENTITYYDKRDAAGNPTLFARVVNGELLLDFPTIGLTVETFHFAENPEEANDITNPDCESFEDLLDKIIGFLTASSSVATAITPVVTGNVDNFDPAGLSTADTIIADNNGNNNLSGLKAPDPAVRARIRFFTKGSGRIRVLDNDPGSDPVNRLLLGGFIDINADEAGIDLEYDTDVSRWRFIGKI